jgi:4-amino-4-deoxy-L-arabinose transferase-like glycosyltransferase
VAGPGSRGSGVAALAIVAGATALRLACLHQGHLWGDDFAQYVLHARNLASGLAYAETGYVFNPDVPDIGPVAYPPVFPLLLAPVWTARGLDLVAMKAVVVVLGAFGTAAVSMLLFRDLGRLLPVFAALVAFDPTLWEHGDYVHSDLPFYGLVMAALLAMERSFEAPAAVGWRWAGAAGVLAGLAVQCRTAGVVLLPALALAEWRRTGRFPRAAALALAAAFPVALLLGLAFPSGQGYELVWQRLSSRQLLRSAQWVGASLVGLLPGLGITRAYSLLAFAREAIGFMNPVRAPAAFGFPGVWAAVLVVLACSGAASRARRLGAIDWFALLYLGLVVAWPVHLGERALIPLVPLLILYLLLGLRQLGDRSTASAWLLGGLLAAAVVLDAWRGRPGATPYRNEAESAEARAFFACVQQRTRPGAAVVFPKPRALALYTGRRAVASADEGERALARARRLAGADYAATGLAEWSGPRPTGDWVRLCSGKTFELFRLPADP